MGENRALCLLIGLIQMKSKCSHILNFLAYSRQEVALQFGGRDPNEVQLPQTGEVGDLSSLMIPF